MPDDPVFDDIPSLTYFTKTKKILKMQRIFIKSRAEVLGDSSHHHCIPNLKTLRLAGVPCRYQEKGIISLILLQLDPIRTLIEFIFSYFHIFIFSLLSSFLLEDFENQ